MKIKDISFHVPVLWHKKQLYACLLNDCLEVFIPAFDRAALDAQQDLFERILHSSRIKLAALSKHPFRREPVLRDMDAPRFKRPEDTKAVYEMLLLMAGDYGVRYASLMKIRLSQFPPAEMNLDTTVSSESSSVVLLIMVIGSCTASPRIFDCDGRSLRKAIVLAKSFQPPKQQTQQFVSE